MREGVRALNVVAEVGGHEFVLPEALIGGAAMPATDAGRRGSMILGRAFFDQGNADEAAAHFQRSAAGGSSRSRGVALAWAARALETAGRRIPGPILV